MRRVLLGLCVSSLLIAAVPDGAALYNTRCAKCHDHPDERIPAKDTLAKRDNAVILKALTAGSMQPFAISLTEPELNALATHLTGKVPTGTDKQAEANLCAS